MTIHKKDNYDQFFVMPCSDVQQAMQPFDEVFTARKAVNTSKLISMKKYKSVAEVYKLY